MSPNSDEPDADDADDPTREQVERRKHLLPEEAVAGSDDPEAEAMAVLEESDQRQRDRSATAVERRRSDDEVERQE
jgi:hypothetical protein